MGEPSGTSSTRRAGAARDGVLAGVTRDVTGAARRDSDDGAIRLQRHDRLRIASRISPTLSISGTAPWSYRALGQARLDRGDLPIADRQGIDRTGHLSSTSLHNRFILERSNVASIAQESGTTTDPAWHHCVVTRIRDWHDHADLQGRAWTSRPRSARRRLAYTTRTCFIGASVPAARASSSTDDRRGRCLQQRADRRLGSQAHLRPASSAGTARAGNPRRRDPARRSGHRRGLRRATRSPRARTLNKRRIIAYGLRNPFRFDVRPGHERAVGGRVGWNNWEEINRVANIGDTTAENSVGRATRAAGGRPATTAANLTDVREPVSRRPGAITAPVYTYSHTGQRRDRRDLPDRRLGHGRHRVLPRDRWETSRPHTAVGCSSPTTPATASGGWPRAPTASPIPRPAPSSSARPRIPSTSRSARMARSTTSTSIPIPSARSRSHPGTSHPPRSPRRVPTSGPAPLTVVVRRAPRPPTRRAAR